MALRRAGRMNRRGSGKQPMGPVQDTRRPTDDKPNGEAKLAWAILRRQPTTNREPSSLLEWPRCEGGRRQPRRKAEGQLFQGAARPGTTTHNACKFTLFLHSTKTSREVEEESWVFKELEIRSVVIRDLQFAFSALAKCRRDMDMRFCPPSPPRPSFAASFPMGSMRNSHRPPGSTTARQGTTEGATKFRSTIWRTRASWLLQKSIRTMPRGPSMVGRASWRAGFTMSANCSGELLGTAWQEA